MKPIFYSFVTLTFLLISLLSTPHFSLAEELAQQEDQASSAPTETRRPGFIHILGSIVFTTLYLPGKIGMCATSQFVAAFVYTGTFGVKGNYDGGTNGREIGEVARRSCTGSWIVRPSQVVRDYGE
jgi:hypothetical protein